MNIFTHEKRNMPPEDRSFYVEMAAAIVVATALALAI